MPKKPATIKADKPQLGQVIMVYTKSSSHGCGLIEPELVTIEGIKFIQGKQTTGKEGHRMEGRRTLIPLEHVASLVEFTTEEDLWSEPQPKNVRVQDFSNPDAILTSHEQPHHKQPHEGPHHRHHGRHRRRHRRDNDRFPGQPNFNR